MKEGVRKEDEDHGGRKGMTGQAVIAMGFTKDSAPSITLTCLQEVQQKQYYKARRFSVYV